MVALRLAAILVAAGLAGCSGSASQISGLAAGETGAVASVRSGDEFTLAGGLVVRLAGVEAPHGVEPGADAARQALSGLVAGKSVTLFYGGARRDRYARAIAQVRVNRVWVQDALLNAGLARVHTWPDNQALAHPMLETEAQARLAGRGLWATPAYRVQLPSEATMATGFTVMEGRVARVSGRTGPLWIDFAEGGTAAMIPAEARAGVRAAGLDPGLWPGRLLRVRGYVNGGVLRLDHAAAVEKVAEPKAGKSWPH